MTEPSCAGLTGRSAVVTGAGRGIGREIAIALARDGVTTVLAGRSEAALAEVERHIVRAGGTVHSQATDVRDTASLERLVKATSDTAGTPDILVCNSAIAGPTSVLWELEPRDWANTLATNLTGPYLCCRAFLPSMIERGMGTVVLIGSATGKRPLYGRTPYAASKMGLVGLMRTLAWELGPYGIRVNLISPGAVEGDRIDGVIRSQAEAKGVRDEEVRASLSSASPLSAFVQAADIAEAVKFLASDAAASITGEDLNVTAGAVMY